jgi:hypothetical protein
MRGYIFKLKELKLFFEASIENLAYCERMRVARLEHDSRNIRAIKRCEVPIHSSSVDLFGDDRRLLVDRNNARVCFSKAGNYPGTVRSTLLVTCCCIDRSSNGVNLGLMSTGI